MAFKDANAAVPGARLPEGDSEVRGGDQPDPIAVRRLLLPRRTATTTCTSPPRRARPPTTRCCTKAIDGLQDGCRERSTDPKLKKLSLEYLVAAYGRDKLNDPTPGRAGRPADDRDGAERADQLLRAGEDLRGRRQLRGGGEDAAQGARTAGRTTRRSTCSWRASTTGRGSSTRRSNRSRSGPRREPNNPEAYYTIATYYWDKAFRDFRLKDPRSASYVQKGIEASDRALKIKGDYIEAIVYKGLLLRLAANLEKDRTQATGAAEGSRRSSATKPRRCRRRRGRGGCLTDWNSRLRTTDFRNGLCGSPCTARFGWKCAVRSMQDQVAVFVHRVPGFGWLELEGDDLAGGIQLVLGGDDEAVDGLHHLRVEP